MNRPFKARTEQLSRPASPPAAPPGPSRWHPAPRVRHLATAALLALLAAILTGHAALLLLAAPPLGRWR